MRQWMTAEPVTVAANSSVPPPGAGEEYRIHHLPVVEGDRPVGMLHMNDMLRQAEAQLDRPRLLTGS